MDHVYMGHDFGSEGRQACRLSGTLGMGWDFSVHVQHEKTPQNSMPHTHGST